MGISNLARRTKLNPTERFLYKTNDSSNAGCKMIWDIVSLKGINSAKQ